VLIKRPSQSQSQSQSHQDDDLFFDMREQIVGNLYEHSPLAIPYEELLWYKNYHSNEAPIPAPAFNINSSSSDSLLWRDQCYYLHIGRVGGIRSVISALPVNASCISLRLQLSFFSLKHQRFFGRTWTSKEYPILEGPIENVGIYYHTTIHDDQVYGVLELVLSTQENGLIVDSYSIGWTLINILANVNQLVPDVDDSKLDLGTDDVDNDSADSTGNNNNNNNNNKNNNKNNHNNENDNDNGGQGDNNSNNDKNVNMDSNPNSNSNANVNTQSSGITSASSKAEIEKSKSTVRAFYQGTPRVLLAESISSELTSASASPFSAKAANVNVNLNAGASALSSISSSSSASSSSSLSSSSSSFNSNASGSAIQSSHASNIINNNTSSTTVNAQGFNNLVSLGKSSIHTGIAASPTSVVLAEGVGVSATKTCAASFLLYRSPSEWDSFFIRAGKSCRTMTMHSLHIKHQSISQSIN
jgi:hypothetical protein